MRLNRIPVVEVGFTNFCWGHRCTTASLCVQLPVAEETQESSLRGDANFSKSFAVVNQYFFYRYEKSGPVREKLFVCVVGNPPRVPALSEFMPF